MFKCFCIAGEAHGVIEGLIKTCIVVESLRPGITPTEQKSFHVLLLVQFNPIDSILNKFVFRSFRSIDKLKEDVDVESSRSL